MGRHRDGMTASCPHFRARCDFRGGHWIQCTMGQKGFGSAWERNQYYMMICCRDSRDCELIDIDMKKARGPKT